MKFSDYYKEMRNKYGFNEGDTPEGIERVRDLLIKKVNAKLRRTKKFKTIRLAKFDRPGMHNWCLVEFWDGGDCIMDPTPEMESAVLQILLDLDQEYDIAEKIVVRPIRIVYDEAGNTYSG